MNDIIYRNSRAARDAPNFFSGDETITRLYTKKATGIRMRTSKKNESGILNQNLCGSNKGYSTWSESDPVGSGYTFANVAYPGASYNIGSMVREKDIGNLMQLMYSCGEYFRFKDIEFVADSHFGHLAPIVYLRLWKIFATMSFNTTRLGISSIEELSQKQLEQDERKQLVETLNIEPHEPDEILDMDIRDYAEPAQAKKKKYRALKSRIHFFEEKLRRESKGAFRV